MKYITTSQTPVYKQQGEFFGFVRSIPAATEITVARQFKDLKSGRMVGVMVSGEFVYIDSLTPLIDGPTVTASRLWDWLIIGGLATAIFIITNNSKS